MDKLGEANAAPPLPDWTVFLNMHQFVRLKEECLMYDSHLVSREAFVEKCLMICPELKPYRRNILKVVPWA